MQGRRVPDVVFKTRVRDERVGGDNPVRWQDLTTQELFGGKRVLVYSLPGAFTPTCSNEQCPAFERPACRAMSGPHPLLLLPGSAS